jgi:hypothetical protein
MHKKRIACRLPQRAFHNSVLMKNAGVHSKSIRKSTGAAKKAAVHLATIWPCFNLLQHRCSERADEKLQKQRSLSQHPFISYNMAHHCTKRGTFFYLEPAIFLSI